MINNKNSEWTIDTALSIYVERVQAHGVDAVRRHLVDWLEELAELKANRDDLERLRMVRWVVDELLLCLERLYVPAGVDDEESRAYCQHVWQDYHAELATDNGLYVTFYECLMCGAHDERYD